MTEQQKQENFIRRITDQIGDRERAEAIADEMRDHLETAIQDYMQMGLSDSEAGEKARKQLGDPAALGFSLERSGPVAKDKWSVVIGILLLAQGIMACRFILAAIAGQTHDWLDLTIVMIMVVTGSFLVWFHWRKTPNRTDQPMMVIRASDRMASMDQVTNGMLLFGLVLILLGAVTSFFGDESVTIPVMNSLFLATNSLVAWSGQRAGNAVYTDGIQPRRGRLLAWSDYTSYRVLVSHTRKGKVYQIKLYGGKVEPILGVESSQLKTVETLVSQFLRHA